MTAGTEHPRSLDFDCEVLIVGAGPTGLTLANLLGTLGVRTCVIEQLGQLIDYPRGVGVDDEALRSFQAAGLVHAVRQHTVANQIMRFVDARGRVLAAIAPTAEPFGWPRRNGFIQPLVDRELALGLQRFEHVRLSFHRSLIGFVQDEQGVDVDVQTCDAAGEPVGASTRMRTRLLVGCDGGRSTVRTQLGLGFDGVSESTRWLVIDLANDPIGTPNVTFRLDHVSPYVELALPHGIRRFEFMVPPGASEAEFESDEKVYSLLARVLPSDVRPEVIRRRVYMHHARIAPTFRSGRVLLAGDAAHLMPVWQGQGFNTGIRDASNLAWKLAMVVKGTAGERLLETYTQERFHHARAMIDLSVLVGRIFVPSNPLLRGVRNLVGPILSRIGPVRRYISEMRFKPMPYFSRGAVVHSGTPRPDGLVGKMFIQPRVADAQGKVHRLDDVIGLRFALIAWSARFDHWIDAQSHRILEQIDALTVVVRPAVQSLQREPPARGLVMSDVDGAFKRWFDDAPGAIVVLRPDRVVAAVCTPWQLGDSLRQLADALSLQQPPVPLAEHSSATETT